ncbi:MAG: prolyl oligopeptidase family serine peptidase [Chloroflexi bacterium]|nr:prolyl oligopeptidase family serine peptidase [Chloroflexota bacterium]
MSVQPVVQKLERPFTRIARLTYLLYLPDSYGQQPDRVWPLLLFLHGAGERGDDINRVRTYGPPQRIEDGLSVPWIVVAPQCPAELWWDAWEIGALLDEVQQHHRVDPDRIMVTGLSMGGFGTWQLAATFPRRFAALVPICGGGEPVSVRRFAHVPVWVFHGAKDPVVPLQRSEDMVTALQRAGAEPKFTIYPDATHNSWTAAYNDPELYEWLDSQRRREP